MATLEELRAQLDGIDNEIIELYKKRMDVCMEIGDIKISEGNKVFDKQREREKLAAVAAKVTEEFHKKGVQELFEQLMSLSRKLQYQLLTKRGGLGRLPFIGVDKLDWENSRIVFQGTEGAYSQAAMEMYFGKDTNSFHVQTFRDAMEAIEEGSADFAVLPIENSSAGAVNEVYDLLVEFENYIVGEVVLPINHTLSGVKGTTLDQIERVYSHPQAFMQSNKFIEEHGWGKVNLANTAISARYISEQSDKSRGCIASANAANIYGLDILHRGINFNDTNTTKFIIVSKDRVARRNADHICISFEMPHESGTLYQMLSHIIYNDLNMTRIESRPVPEKKWEYRFYVEFEGKATQAGVVNALSGINAESLNMKILGNY